MTANNSFCGVGIAFNAKVGGKFIKNHIVATNKILIFKILGIRLLNDAVTDIMEAQAMAFNLNYIDIFTASWGPTDNGELLGKEKRNIEFFL